MLIGGAQGRAEELLLDTATFLERTKVPDVRMERSNVTPGIVRGLFGVRREFLTIVPQGNARLPDNAVLWHSMKYAATFGFAGEWINAAFHKPGKVTLAFTYEKNLKVIPAR